MGGYKDGDVSLTVAWERGEGWLIGRYRIANAGAARLLVFDRLYHTAVTGARSVDAEHGWRWLEAEGLYRVAKLVPDIPAGTRVESPELPYARLLEPGAALDGAALLPVPLDQILPYDMPPPRAAQAEISAIVLSLGFAVVDEAAQPRAIGSGAALAYSLPFDWARGRQRVISSDAVAMAVPMRR